MSLHEKGQGEREEEAMSVHDKGKGEGKERVLPMHAHIQ